jgi:hypothetical protein
MLDLIHPHAANPVIVVKLDHDLTRLIPWTCDGAFVN